MDSGKYNKAKHTRQNKTKNQKRIDSKVGSHQNSQNHQFTTSFWRRNRLAFILAAISAVLYLPTVTYGFVLDDPLVTTLNLWVQKGISGWGQILFNSYRAGSSVSTDSEYLYRPLSVMLFALEWAISPQTPGIHHFMNVLWYASTGFLLFKTLQKMFGLERSWLAFGSTLLFLVHPMHTEVVANIKSRDEILSFFFSILALFYLWDVNKGGVKKILWAGFAFFLALLSKEGSVILLGIAPLALYFFGKGKDWRNALWLVVPFLLWFVMRFVIMGKTGYTPDYNDNQLVVVGISERWATGFLVLGKYFKLLLLPIGLSWDYSYNMIPTVGWSNPWAIVGLLMHFSLLGLGIWGFKNKNFLSFIALAYIGSMFLYSNLFMLIGTLMGERLSYMASLWFCIALAFLIGKLLKVADDINSDWFWNNTGSKKSYLLIVGFIALIWAFLSIQRSGVWKDNYTLVTSDIENNEASFRALQALGDMSLAKYADKKTLPSDTMALLQQSEDGYERSHAIRPTFHNLLGMGNVAYIKRDYSKAAKFFEESYKIIPGGISRDRLVLTYRVWGRYEVQQRNNIQGAIPLLLKSYEYDTIDVMTLQDLGTAYGILKQSEKAIYYFEKALKQSPNDSALLRNLSLARLQLGNK